MSNTGTNVKRLNFEPNEGSVIVFEKEGSPVTTSRLIAEKFQKQHKVVLLAIRNMEASDGFLRNNFIPSSYLNANNKQQPEYIVTQDGFTFLVMGFTGAMAAKFKEDYIKAFREMANRIKQRETAVSAAAREMFDRDRKILELDKEIFELKKNLHMIHAPQSFTIAGYCSYRKLRLSFNQMKLAGKRAKIMCDQYGYVVDQVPDPRWGYVGCYPVDVLREVIG